MKITYINYNNIYLKPQNKQFFKGFDCQESDFEIKNLYELPCPICSFPMLQRNQIDNFVNEIQNTKGEELCILLSKYKKYFHDFESKIAEILSFEAQKHPDKNIAELVSNYINEIFSKYTLQQEDAIKKIKKLTQNLPPSQRKKMTAIIEKYENTYNNDNYFNKQAIIDEIEEEVQGEYSNKKRIIKTIKNMPDIKDKKLEFFIKYTNKSQAEIASRLVKPSFITCEHIKPKSKGGKNNTANYIAECQECNSKRNDMPLLQFIKNIPLFIENLKNYFIIIALKLQSGEISNAYSTYLEDISKTISTETQKKVNIAVPKIEQIEYYNPSNIEQRISQIEKTLENQIKDLEALKKLKAELNQNEEFNFIVEYTILKTKKKYLEIQKKESIEEINKKKSFLNKYYNKITELKNKKKKLETDNLTPKEKERCKKEINKIESFLNSKNFKILEAQLKNAQEKLSQIQNNISQIENRLEILKSKIEFPEDIKSQIELLEAQLSEIATLNQEIAKLNSIINNNNNIEQKIKEKEAQIQALLQENQNIDTSECNEKDLETYKKMNEVIIVAKEMEEKQNQNRKIPQINSLIYQLAQQKAKEIIANLAKNNNLIKIQENLNEISIIIAELNKYYDLLNEKQIDEIKRDELLNKLKSLTPKNELIAKINELSEKYKRAKTNFDSTNIDAKIKNLEKTIEHKKRILTEIKKVETEEEIEELISQI